MNPTIRIRLLDGDYVDTERYTYTDLQQLRADGKDVEVGGEDEINGLSRFPGQVVPPLRTITQAAIAGFGEI